MSTFKVSPEIQEFVDRAFADEGFEVYDARGTSRGLIWVEANIFTRRSKLSRLSRAPFLMRAR